jgi:hypothetical protein
MQSEVLKNVKLFLNRSTFISFHFPFENAADNETGVAVMAASCLEKGANVIIDI